MAIYMVNKYLFLGLTRCLSRTATKDNLKTTEFRGFSIAAFTNPSYFFRAAFLFWPYSAKSQSVFNQPGFSFPPL